MLLETKTRAVYWASLPQACEGVNIGAPVLKVDTAWAALAVKHVAGGIMRCESQKTASLRKEQIK